MTPALALTNVVKSFGGITATDHVTLTVQPGERVALIGPNGAGKTTLINLITGVLTPSSGSIAMLGDSMDRLKPEARVKRGLVRTFQINQLFKGLTPREALRLAVLQTSDRGAVWHRAASRFTDTDARIEALAESVRMSGALDADLTSLSYGQLRQLEIALALACDPKVLLLDEPAAGVPEAERELLLSVIASLPESVTVLLIEHDMDVVFRFAKRIIVLVNGRVIADGAPDAIARDPDVRAAYLGSDDHG